MPREDAHEKLYDAYVEMLKALNAGVQESELRRFEKVLLQELGYGLSLEYDCHGKALVPQKSYRYEIEHGATPLAGSEDTGSLVVRGKTLLDMAAENFTDPLTAVQAKQLMRALMHYYLDGKVLETRKIFRELQDL